MRSRPHTAFNPREQQRNAWQLDLFSCKLYDPTLRSIPSSRHDSFSYKLLNLDQDISLENELPESSFCITGKSCLLHIEQKKTRPSSVPYNHSYVGEQSKALSARYWRPHTSRSVLSEGSCSGRIMAYSFDKIVRTNEQQNGRPKTTKIAINNDDDNISIFNTPKKISDGSCSSKNTLLSQKSRLNDAGDEADLKSSDITYFPSDSRLADDEDSERSNCFNKYDFFHQTVVVDPVDYDPIAIGDTDKWDNFNVTECKMTPVEYKYPLPDEFRSVKFRRLVQANDSWRSLPFIRNVKLTTIDKCILDRIMDFEKLRLSTNISEYISCRGSSGKTKEEQTEYYADIKSREIKAMRNQNNFNCKSNSGKQQCQIRSSSRAKSRNSKQNKPPRVLMPNVVCDVISSSSIKAADNVICYSCMKSRCRCHLEGLATEQESNNSPRRQFTPLFNFSANDSCLYDYDLYQSRRLHTQPNLKSFQRSKTNLTPSRNGSPKKFSRNLPLKVFNQPIDSPTFNTAVAVVNVSPSQMVAENSLNDSNDKTSQSKSKKNSRHVKY